MKSTVISEALKGWCPDGFTREALKVGDVRDFGESTSSLMQEDFIEPEDYEPKTKKPAVIAHDVVVPKVVEPVVVEPVTAEVEEVSVPEVETPAPVETKRKKHR